MIVIKVTWLLTILSRRLTSQGLNVLVERSVHAREFPEYGCFDPKLNGEHATCVHPVYLPEILH